jgi:hypothetical protein
VFDTFTRVAEPNERKLLHCNDCGRSTIHTLEARCTGCWSYDHPIGGHVTGGSDFSLFRCGACDAVCFEKSSWDENVFDHDYDGQMYLPREEVQYPPSSSAEFAFNTDHTPQPLNEIIEEMLYALAGGKLNLATVGLRMVIEFIVNDTKCAGRSLKGKIDDLLAKGFVDDAQHTLLHKIRERGNAGAHQGVAMTKLEMVAGMGIVELLLEKLYNGPRRQEHAIKMANLAFKDKPSVTDEPSNQF